ncbi:MAG: MBL fold metallo-hydrolase [Gemmatimonas sp.]
MIEETRFGDVTALWLSWPRSAWAGYGVHVFVVRNVMIDTGFPGVAPEMRYAVDRFRPYGAFLTHHHEDHAGNVQLLAERGVPIATDTETLARVRKPGRIGLYRHFTWKAMRRLKSTLTPFEDDRLSLIPTPGHCSNHQVVWDEHTGTCFTGDLFLGVHVRVAHSYENPREHVRSLRSVLVRNPARVFCAHRGHIENGVTMLQSKVDWMEETIGVIEQRIDDGQSDRHIQRELLGPLGRTHFISAGDYSPVNLVTAIRKTRPNDSSRSATANGSPSVSASPSAPRARQ